MTVVDCSEKIYIIPQPAQSFILSYIYMRCLLVANIDTVVIDRVLS